MPGATHYAPDDKDLRQAAADELLAHRTAAEKAWKYYRRQHPKSLKVKPGEPDDNIIVNLFKQAVDRIKSFMIPGMPGLELGETTDPDAEAVPEIPGEPDAEDRLKKTWERAGGAKLLGRFVMQGCMSGHNYARVIPDQEYPRIICLNPANVVTFWQADDMDVPLWYELYWTVGKTEYRQDIVKDGSGWFIQEWARERDSNSQFTSSDGQNRAQVWKLAGPASIWAYPLGPIIDWQHGEDPCNYYGMSEADNLELNDSMNRKASDVSRILRYFAGPRTVGTGFEAEKLTATGIDNFWTISSADAKVYNLEMSSDLVSSHSYVQFLRDMYLSERRVVVLKGDIAAFQRVTNLGIQVLYQDESEKCSELHLNYDGGIQRISQVVLMLMGLEYREPPSLHWPSPLPQDPLETLQVQQGERDLGIVSKETIARERGRDWVEEQARMDAEGDSQAGLIERVLRNQGGGSDRTSPPNPLSAGREGANSGGMMGGDNAAN